MSLEAYTGKIADLVVTNPTPTDPKSQGDDHLRGIKYTLQQTFPGFDGPLAASRVPFTPAGNIVASNVQAALQEVDAETQAGLATKVSKSGDTMTGQLTAVGIGVSDGTITRRFILNSADANLRLTNFQDTLYVFEINNGGDVLGGNFSSSVAQSPQVNSLTRKDYVDSLIPSDSRLKDNIQPLTDALGMVRQMRGVTFSWNDRLADPSRVGNNTAGVIAQEVERVFPRAVYGDEQKAIEVHALSGLLIEAVKELSAKLDAAVAEIAALKAAK